MTEEKRFSGVTVAGPKEAPAISTADHWEWCEDHNTPKAICGCGSDDGQATTTGHVVIGDQRILPPPTVEPTDFVVKHVATALAAMPSAEIDGVAELLVRFNRDNALRLAHRMSDQLACVYLSESVIGTIRPSEFLLEPNGATSSAPQEQAPVANEVGGDAPATLTGELLVDPWSPYTFEAGEVFITTPRDIPLEPAPYETVHRPTHYDHPTIRGLQAITIIRDFPYNIATAMGYLWRCGRKPGVDPIEDLRKTIKHAEDEIDRLETARKGGATWPNV